MNQLRMRTKKRTRKAFLSVYIEYQAAMRIIRKNILFPSNSPKTLALQLFTGKVEAGFPSPVDGYVEKSLV
jgi:hypothetical protein